MAAHDNPYGGNAPGNESEICMTGTNSIEDLMRRINALEAALDWFSESHTIGSGGIDPGEFGTLTCLDVYDGRIYAGDSERDKIVIFDEDGDYVSEFTHYNAVAIKVYEDEVYVLTWADSVNYKVYVYDLDGVEQRKFAKNPTAFARGIAVSDDEIYVSFSGRIYVYELDGTPLRNFATYPTPPGLSNTPGQMDFYNGELYVVINNSYVNVFNSSGALQRTIRTPGCIRGIAVHDGYIYLADTGIPHCIRRYETDGTAAGVFFAGGSPLRYDVALSTSYLFAAETGNDVIRAYSFTGYPQTEFHAYKSTGPVSLGTPDGGASVPANLAIESADGDIDCNMILDCRAAIEDIVATGQTSYNWAASSPDNLYYVAMGDRTKYGATGGAAYTWTRSGAAMENSDAFDIDIGEIYECVLKLEDDVL